MSVLPDLSAKSHSELEAMVLAMQAKLDRAGQRKLTIKVTEKGGVAVYGLGKFPVSLYKSQWDRLLPMAGEIASFISDNAERLSVKE